MRLAALAPRGRPNVSHTLSITIDSRNQVYSNAAAQKQTRGTSESGGHDLALREAVRSYHRRNHARTGKTACSWLFNSPYNLQGCYVQASGIDCASLRSRSCQNSLSGDWCVLSALPSKGDLSLISDEHPAHTRELIHIVWPSTRWMEQH